MGFLVDDRSVIGVSNLVVAFDYKDANVPVAKFCQREDRGNSQDQCGRRKLENDIEGKGARMRR